MNTTYTAHVILFRLCPSHVAMLAEVEQSPKFPCAGRPVRTWVLLEMKRGVSDNLFSR